MKKYGYLIVEGQHEIAFIGRLLKEKNINIKSIQMDDELDPHWTDLVPTKFPHDGYLLKRVPVPAFFQNDEYSIAIYEATGDTNIPTFLEDMFINFANRKAIDKDSTPFENLVGLGIIIDANSKKVVNKFNDLKDDLTNTSEVIANIPAIKDLSNPGQVVNGNPNAGIFILPNNNDKGTLETILLKCAETAYPELYQDSCNFISQVEKLVDKLDKDDRRDFKKPAGKEKATVGCVANVLRPCKSVQVSIKDNSWVRKGNETLNIREVSELDNFITKLFDLS